MILKNKRIASDEYVALLKDMHNRQRRWGHSRGHKLGTPVMKWIKEFGLKSVLDYGTGHGRVPKFLRENLPDVEVYGYEFGEPGGAPMDKYGEFPDKVEFLVSGDVMEHVEPEFLKNVIDLQKETATKYMYHKIHKKPACQDLADGRNAHLIQEEDDWWQEQYEDENWECISRGGNNVYVGLLLKKIT